MFGFFDKGISWTQGMQLYNAAVISVAAYSLITDPQGKVADLGLALCTHAFSTYCLNETTGFGAKLLGVGGNLFRLGAIYAGVTSGCTNASWTLNALSACASALNSTTLLFCDRSDEDDAKAIKKPQ